MSSIIHASFTHDDILAQEAMQSTQLSTAEMLSKNMIFSEDIGTGNYDNNIVTFQLQSISNSNHVVDIKNSYIILPMLGKLETTVPISLEQARYSMIMKSSDSVIHNIDIELSNAQVQEGTNNISMYTGFVNHTTGSSNKRELHTSLKTYHKMTGDAWYFDEEAGIRQDTLSIDGEKENRFSGEVYNTGVTSDLNYVDDRKRSILNTDAMKKSGAPFLEKSVDGKTWYYHHYCKVRLGDISTFCEQLPLISGPYFQLKVRLNQISDYKITVTPATIITKSHNMSNESCPFFRGSTESDFHGEFTTGPGGELIAGADIPTNDFTYQLKLGNVGGYPHKMSRPRWVMASYSLSESLDSQILSNPVRTLNYTELIHSQFMNQKGYFSLNLASSTRDIEKLIIIPVLSASMNGKQTGGTQVNGLMSCTHGNNTSPINITNMRLNISGRPLYTQPLTYGYENFLQEMHNVNGTESSNGSISLKDFANLYHYYVFDLSRIDVSDIGAKASYEVSGTIDKGETSAGKLEVELEYDFYVFMVQRKNITVDITTAQIM